MSIKINTKQNYSIKKIFQGLITLFLLIALNISTAYATEYPLCPFPAQAGRTIVNFPRGAYAGDPTYEFTERIVSDTVNYPEYSFKTPPVSASLSAGKYDVRIFGADAGIDRINLHPKELNERFFIILNKGSAEVARTNSTDDLPDDVNSVGVEKLVNTGLSINQNIDSIIAYHSNYPDSASANSIVPVCAAFDLIPPVPPTPIPISPTSNPPVIPGLTLIKTVMNTGGGEKTIADFPLFIGSTQVASGVAAALLPGTYKVSETGNSDYTASAWGGDCSANGNITLSSGDNKICTITNTYNPPVVNSGGRRSNRRQTPVSGSPLINVTKIPNPASLSMGGGLVAYVYRVTNPGEIPLTNITLTDDKCSPINYISGNLNNDVRLDMNEEWIYTCYVTLTSTTTNIVTAVGVGGGETVRDTATATVLVAAPGFPKTGLPFDGSNNLMNIIMFSSTLGLPLFLYIAAKRKIT